MKHLDYRLCPNWTTGGCACHLEPYPEPGVPAQNAKLVKNLRDQAEAVEYCAGDYAAWDKRVGYAACELMREAADALSAQVPAHGLHPDTADLVQRFAAALAEKLRAAELKYGYSNFWKDDDWLDECRAKLHHHLAKGDPLDVTAYCAFLWHHGASTSAAPAQNAELAQRLRRLHALKKPAHSGVRGQQCGLEMWTITASGNDLEVLHEAADALSAQVPAPDDDEAKEAAFDALVPDFRNTNHRRKHRE